MIGEKIKWMKYLGLFIACFTIFQVQSFAQPTGESQGRIIGKVTSNNGNVEAASVYLYLIRENDNESLAGGKLTNKQGEFDIAGLTFGKQYRLEITGIGFKVYEQVFTFTAPRDGEVTVDLGKIQVTAEADFLDVVTVTGQKNALQMGIDRKTFDVAKSLNSTGGTAVDIMRNIPSVSVDVDGNVTLRRNSPQIFVDGRPTILTLDQIPADNIERVELITNPSAKFDAASSGGVINVILKKDKKLGLNGNLTLGTGIPKNNNANLSLNWREGKFNFFVNGSYNNSYAEPEGKSFRINKSNGTTTDYYNQNSISERDNTFQSIRFGADYYIDNNNILTLSQSFTKGTFESNQTQQQEWLDAGHTLTRTGQRYTIGENGFNRSSTRLNYERKFSGNGRKLTADITYNNGGGNNFSEITNSNFAADGSPLAVTPLVRNNGKSTNNQVTFQTDYETSIGDYGKLETGARIYIDDQKSVFESFSVANGVSTKLPLSNNIAYTEKVYAGYATYGNELPDMAIKYQVGLRAEYSRFDGRMVDSNRTFGYELPTKLSNIMDGLYPSLFLTKTLGNGDELQLNFSRRVRRPNFWQINPFVDISDAVNIRKGTPGLKPMFTNSFELNYNKVYDKGNMLATVYYRSTTNYITMFADTISPELFEELKDANIEPTAIVNEFINGNSRNRWGTELVLQHRFSDNFDITPSVNFQYTMVSASTEKMNLSNEGFNWDGKIIANYRFPHKAGMLKSLSVQGLAEYESPEVTPQGRRKEVYVANLALRKQFMKNNRATLTFAVNDIFNTDRRGMIYDTPFYYQDSYNRRNVRNFRLTFNYKFGKADFSLFKRNDRKGGERDDDRGDFMSGGGPGK